MKRPVDSFLCVAARIIPVIALSATLAGCYTQTAYIRVEPAALQTDGVRKDDAVIADTDIEKALELYKTIAKKHSLEPVRWLKEAQGRRIRDKRPRLVALYERMDGPSYARSNHIIVGMDVYNDRKAIVIWIRDMDSASETKLTRSLREEFMRALRDEFPHFHVWYEMKRLGPIIYGG